MSPYASVSIFCGRAILQIHSLENGVFAILLFDGQHGLLNTLFLRQPSGFRFLLRLFSGIICKKVQLLHLFRFRRVCLIYDMSRTAAYKWLSKKMGLPEEKTHIGGFEMDQCQQVIDISRQMETAANGKEAA